MNWIGRKRCSVKYAVNGWKGISLQTDGIFPGLILTIRMFRQVLVAIGLHPMR
jgi:hypothetical protein